MNEPPMHPLRKLCFALTAALTTGAVVAFCLQAQGQDPIEPKTVASPEVADCQPRDVKRNLDKVDILQQKCGGADCHSASSAAFVRMDTKIAPICGMNELTNWKRDRHHEAYTVLLGSRAQTMGKLLSTEIEVEGRVEQSKECLACHSAVLEQNHDSDFQLEEGVSCRVCHGLDGKWTKEHSSRSADERDSWRLAFKEDRASLTTEYGLIDVWTPTNRARLCASCHIGDHAVGKVVTHAMYAAGHPVLPGVEFATFANSMPRHWQTFNEKVAASRDGGGQVAPSTCFSTTQDEANFEQTRFMLVSAMVGLEQSARLLADEAGSVKSWPFEQFAVFACTACHHELNAPAPHAAAPHSTSIATGRLGRPLPVMRRAPLVFLAEKYSGSKAQDPSQYFDAILTTCNQQPFGDPNQVRLSASKIADWAKEQAESLVTIKIDHFKAWDMLKDLKQTIGPKYATDYDSARQVIWAYQTIYNERYKRPADEARAIPGIHSVRVALPNFVNHAYESAIGEAPPTTLSLDQLTTRRKEQQIRGDENLASRVANDLEYRKDFDLSKFREEIKLLELPPPLPRPKAGTDGPTK